MDLQDLNLMAGAEALSDATPIMIQRFDGTLVEAFAYRSIDSFGNDVIAISESEF